MRRKHYAYEARTNERGYSRFYGVWSPRVPHLRFIVDVNRSTGHAQVFVTHGRARSTRLVTEDWLDERPVSPKAVERFLEGVIDKHGEQTVQDWIFPPLPAAR